MAAAALFGALVLASSHALGVYKCSANGATVYQDTPCATGDAGRQVGPESQREAATRRQAEADAKERQAAANAKREKSAGDAKRAEAIKEYKAEQDAWWDARGKVKVGMTQSDLLLLHKRLAYGGEKRTVTSNGRVDEWRTFDGLTLHLVNGVVESISQ